MSARDFALASLDQWELPDWPQAQLATRRHRAQMPTDRRDIELASRIYMTAVENLLRINWLIEHFSSRPIRRIDPIVRKILGVALVQILFLDRIPHAAAVDEAVKQARRFGKKSAAPFVNAVLRRATRETPPPLPDANNDPREYARLALSHPPELFDRLVALLGVEDALLCCRHDNREPPTILRLAAGVTIAQLVGPDYSVVPHEQPGMAVVNPAHFENLIDWSVQGLAQPQDPTSAAVVSFCDVQPGHDVLDRCCGMGTKTQQLLQQLGEKGSIVAIDASPMRVDNLRRLMQSRKIENVHAIHGTKVQDAEPWVPEEGFDRVLVDVPCSNSGVLARRIEARYYQSHQAMASLHKLQIEILADTASSIAAGGLLIYSTCSIWPEENEQMVQKFLESTPAFDLLSQQSTLPSFKTDGPTHYHDGGYVAVLRKR